MFTKNNTMNEILNTEPVGRAAGNLFPTCFMARVPVEHRDHTMAQIEKEETMEWSSGSCSSIHTASGCRRRT